MSRIYQFLRKVELHLPNVSIILFSLLLSYKCSAIAVIDSSEKFIESRVHINGGTLTTGLMFNKNSSFSLRTYGGISLLSKNETAGYNDSEKGLGLILGTGLRYFTEAPNKGFYVGINAELWPMRYAWKKQNNQPPSGNSIVLNCYPNVELGYLIRPVKTNYALVISWYQGYLFHVISSGRKTGSGYTTMLGICLQITK